MMNLDDVFDKVSLSAVARSSMTRIQLSYEECGETLTDEQAVTFMAVLSTMVMEHGDIDHAMRVAADIATMPPELAESLMKGGER